MVETILELPQPHFFRRVDTCTMQGVVFIPTKFLRTFVIDITYTTLYDLITKGKLKGFDA